MLLNWCGLSRESLGLPLLLLGLLLLLLIRPSVVWWWFLVYVANVVELARQLPQAHVWIRTRDI